MPIGKWSGWYFSEELQFASLNGYKIKVIKGYKFGKSSKVFDNYVTRLYGIKSDPANKGAISSIAKNLLNSLLGRFGMNVNKPVTKLVDYNELVKIQGTRVMGSTHQQITQNDSLVSYFTKIDKDICESHNVDYYKIVLDNISKSEFKDLKVNKELMEVSLTTSAAVYSYARIYMKKIKLDLLSKGVSLYYTDTDSLVTDKPLNDNLVGNDIGQFKLEHIVK